MAQINADFAHRSAIAPTVLLGRDGRDNGDFGWLDALPVAAGIVAGEGSAVRLIAGNAAFKAVHRRVSALRPNANLIALVMRTHVASHGDRTSFLWHPPGTPGRQLLVHVAPIEEDDAGEPRALLTLLDRDAFDREDGALRSELRSDILTGLPNRRAFVETLDAVIKGNHEEDGGFAVLTLNLTRFSRINEAMGSLKADELISRISRRLVACIRKGDMLARLIGDEFGVLVRLVDGPGDALHVARRLQEALATPIRLDRMELRIGCAIGCSVWHDRVRTGRDVVRNAQFALKRAKRSGRVEVFEPGEIGPARRRFTLEADLRNAIEGDKLRLAFQPIVDLEKDIVVGFEALARWDNSGHGTVSPTEFVAVAEETGLIVPLGRWALDRAIATLKDWDMRAGQALTVRVGVNVSPVQLARDHVEQGVEAALRRHGIGGERLTLELTESSIVADPKRAAGMLSALKALSCQIAMDDFGTGHSCLASLQRLPIDVLKIDRQFVRGMLHDRDSMAIVRAILGLAKALGMFTIAEGIESAATARALTGLGADLGQGYHFAKAMPEEEAFAYLMARQPPRG